MLFSLQVGALLPNTDWQPLTPTHTASTFVANSSSASSPVASFYLYYLRPLLPVLPTAPSANPAPPSCAANPAPPSRAANPVPPSRAANPVPPSRAANPVLPATCPVISRTLLPCPQLQLRHLYKTTTADFCFSTFVANSTAHFISITALQSGVVLPLLPNSACCKPCPSSPTAAVLPATCPVISRALFTLPTTATAPPVKRHNSR